MGACCGKKLPADDEPAKDFTGLEGKNDRDVEADAAQAQRTRGAKPHGKAAAKLNRYSVPEEGNGAGPSEPSAAAELEPAVPISLGAAGQPRGPTPAAASPAAASPAAVSSGPPGSRPGSRSAAAPSPAPATAPAAAADGASSPAPAPAPATAPAPEPAAAPAPSPPPAAEPPPAPPRPKTAAEEEQEQVEADRKLRAQMRAEGTVTRPTQGFGGGELARDDDGDSAGGLAVDDVSPVMELEGVGIDAVTPGTPTTHDARSPAGDGAEGRPQPSPVLPGQDVPLCEFPDDEWYRTIGHPREPPELVQWQHPEMCDASGSGHPYLYVTFWYRGDGPSLAFAEKGPVQDHTMVHFSAHCGTDAQLTLWDRCTACCLVSDAIHVTGLKGPVVDPKQGLEKAFQERGMDVRVLPSFRGSDTAQIRARGAALPPLAARWSAEDTAARLAELAAMVKRVEDAVASGSVGSMALCAAEPHPREGNSGIDQGRRVSVELTCGGRGDAWPKLLGRVEKGDWKCATLPWVQKVETADWEHDDSDSD
eukprot:TRINITY_DN50244_c0_g1_i1.p1 TRINITY_DN50244_c0_g1~~TRINITY_DN50244_c0_g1_i1.p1  ORF type:complete len:536 (+),score=95.11 TRINITY_DN50244_c0_g1_i1:86-1693(+)